MRRLVIIGAGGHGREVLDVVEAVNARARRWQVLGFLADRADGAGLVERRGMQVLGDLGELAGQHAEHVVAIGDTTSRRAVARRADLLAEVATPLVHPDARVSPGATLLPGSVLFAGARLERGVRIGHHTHCNLNAHCRRDVLVGDHVFLGQGVVVETDARLGDGAFVGSNSWIAPGCAVGEDAVVGAGSTVTRDVAPGSVVVGSPARPLDAHP